MFYLSLTFTNCNGTIYLFH